jgi:hypothetical protein
MNRSERRARERLFAISLRMTGGRVRASFAQVSPSSSALPRSLKSAITKPDAFARLLPNRRRADAPADQGMRSPRITSSKLWRSRISCGSPSRIRTSAAKGFEL